MINIKDAAGLAKRAINRMVIAITNCHRTAGGQGPLFIYRDICPRAGYTDALQTAHVTKIVSHKQPTDALQRCLRGVRCTAPRTGRCATPDELIYSSLAASQIDRFLDKLKCSPCFRSLMYRTNSSLSQALTDFREQQNQFSPIKAAWENADDAILFWRKMVRLKSCFYLN